MLIARITYLQSTCSSRRRRAWPLAGGTGRAWWHGRPAAQVAPGSGGSAAQVAPGSGGPAVRHGAGPACPGRPGRPPGAASQPGKPPAEAWREKRRNGVWICHGLGQSGKKGPVPFTILRSTGPGLWPQRAISAGPEFSARHLRHLRPRRLGRRAHPVVAPAACRPPTACSWGPNWSRAGRHCRPRQRTATVARPAALREVRWPQVGLRRVRRMRPPATPRARAAAAGCRTSAGSAR